MKTNNIVAQFASSVWKDNEAERAHSLNFLVGDFKEYPVVSGSVFDEEYNETLNSATIVLSQIVKEDRLSDIKPYQYVRVYDKSDNTGYDKLFLIDNFDEVENNITEHIFGYTINFMSETKWLEKFQCPNLTITHEVKPNGSISKKTIYQKIEEYMELYVPKIKFSNGDGTWKYEPLIKMPVDDNLFYQKFNVPCADMGFSAPTLRQLLTILMQQVGCIPTVNNRTLGFLDFQLNAVPFGGETIDYTLNNTVNSISRSLSSDSYVNTLINISENVLDSGNQVICETLGFRDIEKALLKQEENLFLETKFPIYKVEEFKINSYINAVVDFESINWYVTNIGPDTNHRASWSIEFSKPSLNTVALDFNASFGIQSTDVSLKISGTLTAFEYNGTSQNFNISHTILASDFQPGVSDVLTFNLEKTSYDKFYFNGTLTITNTITQEKVSIRVFVLNFAGVSNALCLYTQDITPLLLENSIRQNLNTNFQQMVNETSLGVTPAPTISTLAKYVYGTIGYSIGSKKISGFSDVYNVGSSSLFGWIQANYTYIENIWTFITTYYQNDIKSKIRKLYANMPVVLIDGQTNITFSSITPYNPQKRGAGISRIFTTDINFSYLLFDIKYQPLNTFNLSYVKSDENIDIGISQYDGNVSSLSDFDRLSIHEQEQVDRIGNETLVIKQRTNDFSEIQTFENGPLSFMDDTNRSGGIDGTDNGVNYIVFKRSFTIKNNCFNVSYVGSKDAILKNYFTSIRTKYRAYQYVDYNNSVVRKERDTVFVKLSENGWYDGDDKVYLGGFNLEDYNKQQQLLMKFLGSWSVAYHEEPTINNSGENSVKYNVLADNNIQTRNDISVVSYDTFFAVISEEKDNVGSGTYISNNSFQQAFDNEAILLGGVPQSWQIWDQDYYDSHIVSYVSNLYIQDLIKSYVGYPPYSPEIIEQFNKFLSLPILDNFFVNLETNELNNVVFSVVNNNKNVLNDVEDRKRIFYKDLAEIINHTIQFIYYTDSKNIIWTENFFKGNDISGLFNFDSLDCVSINNEEFKISSTPYQGDIYPLEPSIFENYHFIHLKNGSAEGTNPYIEILWRMLPISLKQFKLVGSKTIGSITYRYDMIAFRRTTEEEQRFYITLNDTKTDYVMGEKNGILYQRYKVVNNTLNRLAVQINHEEIIPDAPIVQFNINNQDFVDGISDSYNFVVTNNNPVAVDMVFEDSGYIIKKVSIPANSTVTLRQTSELNNALDEYVSARNINVVGYFEYGEMQSSSVVVLEARDIIPPTVTSSVAGSSFNIIVRNDNLYQVYLNIDYSGGTLQEIIPPYSTRQFNQNDLPELIASAEAYDGGQLVNEVTCYFENSDYGFTSTTVMIWDTY